MSLALPGEDHSPVDLCLRPEIHHEDRLVHIVIVHDGTVGQVGALLTVHRQGAVPVLPLLPGVPLVVHPGLSLEGFIGHCKVSVIEFYSQVKPRSLSPQPALGLTLRKPGPHSPL